MCIVRLLLLPTCGLSEIGARIPIIVQACCLLQSSPFVRKLQIRLVRSDLRRLLQVLVMTLFDVEVVCSGVLYLLLPEIAVIFLVFLGGSQSPQ